MKIAPAHGPRNSPEAGNPRTRRPPAPPRRPSRSASPSSYKTTHAHIHCPRFSIARLRPSPSPNRTPHSRRNPPHPNSRPPPRSPLVNPRLAVPPPVRCRARAPAPPPPSAARGAASQNPSRRLLQIPIPQGKREREGRADPT